ncbi:MAG: hypothetical protein Q4E91_09930 [Lachnospiraceae bacterium]|nr:hypothetical protein [Lachnospiraceae bacterium]
MRKKKQRYILGYVVGAAGLAAVTAIAWFVPDWYAGWQEQYLMENVTVSSRGEIQFLDTNSLDVISRLKLMEEEELLEWEWMQYDGVYLDVRNKVNECCATAENWQRHGLLPDFTKDVIKEDSLIYFRTFVGMSQENMIPFLACRFEDGSDLVTIVADAEKDMIYYISVSGYQTEEYMAQCLGYENMESLRQAVNSDIYWTGKEEAAAYDFAGICGAESASVKIGDGNLDLDAVLNFDSFEGHAYRRMVYTDRGDGSYGFRIYFGRNEEILPMLVSETMAFSGFVEADAWLEGWLKTRIVQEEEYKKSSNAFAEE